MASDVDGAAEDAWDDEWPIFPLRYTFNPQDLAGRERVAPDELVVFDPSHSQEIGGAWITAERGAYVAIEDVR